MRKALIVVIVALAAVAGLGAGYFLWGIPTDW
jgi:hypothetical protein